MSPSHSRRRLLALGSVISTGLLAGCLNPVTPFNRDSPYSRTEDGDDDTLGFAYSKSRGSSFPGDGESHSGWVHIVSDGESADLTFDVRLCRSLGAVEPELGSFSGNEYVLRFDVTADLDGKSVASGSIDESACDSVTHVTGGGNVPNDWETLRVYVNDTEIQAIERSGTMPEMRPLPDPVHFE